MKLLSRHWPSLRDHESLHRACRWLRSPPLPHWWSLNTGGIDHPSPPENCYLSGFLGWNFHLHWLHFLPNCVHCWLMSETSKTSTDVCFFRFRFEVLVRFDMCNVTGYQTQISHVSHTCLLLLLSLYSIPNRPNPSPTWSSCTCLFVPWSIMQRAPVGTNNLFLWACEEILNISGKILSVQVRPNIMLSWYSMFPWICWIEVYDGHSGGNGRLSGEMAVVCPGGEI